MQKKTLLLQSVHKLKRIWILCLISLCIVPLNAQTFYKIEMPNYILQASGTNTETLYIKNKESENLIQLGKLKFGWTPAITMENTCSYEIIEVNGYQAIRATYTFPSSVPSSITLTGTFIARPDRVDVQYLGFWCSYWICHQLGRLTIPLHTLQQGKYPNIARGQTRLMATGCTRRIAH